MIRQLQLSPNCTIQIYTVNFDQLIAMTSHKNSLEIEARETGTKAEIVVVAGNKIVLKNFSDEEEFLFIEEEPLWLSPSR